MFTLPPLPYQLDALEPVISARTLDYHYNKHHRTYVDKLNELIKGTACEGQSLEEIIAGVCHDVDQRKIFNNAAQTWNHTFFWSCLSPRKQTPSRKMLDLLKDGFGGLSEFNEKFAKAANDQFGSGWAWLVQTPGGRLEIVSTSNAENPLQGDEKPLLTLDVWEHAYYLDYQNARPEFTKAVVEKLLNWDFAETNLSMESPQAALKSQFTASTLRH